MSNRIVRVVRRGRAGEDGSFGLTTVATQAIGFTASVSQRAYYFRCTAALTMALDAAATLGNGWHCLIDANGGDVTVDPNASEQVNGANTATVSDGNMAWLTCDGSAFYLRFLLSSEVADLLGATTAGGIRDVLELDNESTLTATGGSSNAYTLTPPNTTTAYASGQRHLIRINHANSGAATLNVDSLGAKDIQKYDSAGSLVALAAGDLLVGDVHEVTYDGTRFVLLTLPKVIDDDDFADDSPVRPPSQQSTLALARNLVRGNPTAVADLTNSGANDLTSYDFTGLASDIQMIELDIEGVSLDGATNILVQFRVSSSPVTSGYAYYYRDTTAAAATASGSGGEAGFTIISNNASFTGISKLRFSRRPGTNIWSVWALFIEATNDGMWLGMGQVSLAGAADGLRIRSVNGTSAFDAGAAYLRTF